MARHEHAHEVLRLAVCLVAGDDDLVHILVIEIADRALDEVAFLVDEARRLACERQIAHALPQPQQIFEVAFDLLLRPRSARRADDQAHALRHLELGRDGLEALAVLRLGDLAGDAAAARGVGHQNRVAAGERKVGRQSRALVAALLLHDLHQDHLAALDDLLDLVAARTPARARRQLLHGVFAPSRPARRARLRWRALVSDLVHAAFALGRSGRFRRKRLVASRRRSPGHLRRPSARWHEALGSGAVPGLGDASSSGRRLDRG